MSHLQDLFKQFDRNQDGFLDRNELADFYNSIGRPMRGQDLETQIKYLSPRKDGMINFNEFRKIVS